MPNKLPRWDLSAYYSGTNDPRIKSDFKRASNAAEKFEKRFRGKLNANLKAKILREAIRQAEWIYNLSAKPVIYASLVFSTRLDDHQIAALKQSTSKAYTDIHSRLIFFTLELAGLNASKLNALANDPVLAAYRNFIRRILKSKPHRLTEPEEKILAQKSLTGHQAFIRLFEEHMSGIRFPLKLNGRVQPLSQTKTLALLLDPSRTKRKAAAHAVNQGLEDNSRILTFIFNTLGDDKSINDSLARFDKPEQSRHLDNEISQDVVDAMSGAITEGYPIVSEYYRLKKKIMGVGELFDYDRYAPIQEPKRKIPFLAAKDIVLGSFAKFSPILEEVARKFFDDNWIDAEPHDGKQGGAYCSTGTTATHPAVLMNYLGRMEDVQTLAHELGHGINDWLMRKQTPFNYDTTLVMAETASVFAEMLVFNDLKAQVKDKLELRALYMKKIEGMFSTVFRQHAMHLFERDFHALKKEKGELATDEINSLWRKRQSEMYGKSVTLTPGFERWWSYIPHFLHTPFYVYAYAFGELLVLSLFARYQAEGASFVPKYLKLMEAGASATPQELLKPLGINLKDKEFWRGGVQVIRDMVKEASRMA